MNEQEEEEENELMPFEVNHFDSDTSYQKAFNVEAKKIRNLADFTTFYIQQCTQEDTKWEETKEKNKITCVAESKIRKKIDRLYKIWVEHLVEYFEPLFEIKDYEIDDEFDPITFKPRRFKHCTGMQIFVELTRLFYLKQRPVLLIDFFPEEMLRLSMMQNTIWVQIVQTFDISKQYKEKEEKDDDVEKRLLLMKQLWEKPILFYSQSEIILIVFFLIQQLNEIKENCIDEFQQVFETVWIRIGQIILELHGNNVLDEPDMRVQVKDGLYMANRNFFMFCSIYMSHILRRFFYYNLFVKRKTEFVNPAETIGKTLRVKKWVEDVIHGFAEEAFSDMYVEHCSTAYVFPGDEKWFKYLYPNKIASTAAYLAEFRPHLYRQYFSESQASKKAVLASVETSHIARTFILKAISNYVQIKSGNNEIKFYDGNVIHSLDLNISYYLLTSNRCPVIVQGFSSYWAYDDSMVQPTDCIYQTIMFWFYLLKERYDSLLHEYSLHRFIKESLSGSGGGEKENATNQNVFTNRTATFSSLLI